MRPPPHSPREMRLLAAATGVVATVEFIVIAVLPVLADDFGVSLNKAGWLVAAFALSAGLVGPTITLLTARWQAHRSLALGMAIFGVGSLITALESSFEVMLAARLVQGALLTPILSLASATAAARAMPGEQGRSIGSVNLGSVIGIVLAVPAGVALVDLLGWRPVSGVLGICALVVAAALRWTFQPVHLPEPGPQLQVAILRRPRFLAHLGLSIALFSAMFASYSYIAPFLEHVWGYSGTSLAIALFGFGLAGLLGNEIAARWVDRGPTRLSAALIFTLIVAVCALPFTGSYLPLGLILLGIWGAAHTAEFLTSQVRVMFAAPDAVAFAASLNIAASNLGIAAGAVLGGRTVAELGIEALGLSTLVAGGVALLLCVGLGLRPEVKTSSASR